MKKLISLTLVLALATVFAAGCKKKEEAPARGSESGFGQCRIFSQETFGSGGPFGYDPAPV